MFLILLLCIKLSILQFSLSNGISCTGRNDKDKLTLIDTDNMIQRQMNREFVKKCGDYYDYEIATIHDDEMVKNFNALKYTNVIYLFFNGSDNDESWMATSGLAYAGDVFYETNISTICVKSNDIEPKLVCKHVVKLVSESIKNINNGDLFDFISQMQYFREDILSRPNCSTVLQAPRDLKTILLCVDDYVNPYRVNLDPLRLQVTTECEKYVLDPSLNSFLAILAPKPVRVESEYLTPTIFFKTSFLSPDIETAYPNSLNLVNPLHLKHGFVEFIKRVGWQRVVIVSDESFQSTELEPDLITILNENKIAYYVIHCVRSKCDINKATQILREIKARVVAIANVEEENAVKLVQNSPSWVTWLVRGIPEFYQLYDRQNIFSFTLGSLHYPHLNACNLDNDILDGLNSIVKAYKSLKENDFKLNKNKFYSLLGEVMRNTKRSSSMIYVHKILKWKAPQEVMAIQVEEDNVRTIQYDNPFAKKSDDGPNCLVRSNVFLKPCQDELIIVLMFVIILFATSVLMITCYFHNTAPVNDPRYQHF